MSELTLDSMVATDPRDAHSSITPGHLKFGPNSGFYRELSQRVDRYFQSTGLPRRGSSRMYVKSAIIAVWLTSTYALLLLFAQTWWLALPLAVSLGLAMAAVGFNIQHDGGHHAYSDRPWVNRLMTMSLDILGGSSYVWARKHNSIHHTYSNIVGHDDDISIGILGRLAPEQPRLAVHRFQHYYLWLLYGLLPLKWQLYDDFRDVLLGKVGGHRLARPRGWNLAVFLGGKAAFFTLSLVVPLLLYPVSTVLWIYLVSSIVQGVTLSLIFQMAHCVEDAAFPMPHADTGRIEKDWAVHQVETTVDFGRKDRVLSWFAGGLNFQIEHHLFPQICHVHYPALSQVVEETCREFGVRYSANETFWAGAASHFRWLRRMGAAPGK